MGFGLFMRRVFAVAALLGLVALPAAGQGWELAEGAAGPEARVCAETGGCFALGCADGGALGYRLVLPEAAVPGPVAISVDGWPAGALVFAEANEGLRAPYSGEGDARLIARLRGGNRAEIAGLVLPLAGSSRSIGAVLGACPLPPVSAADPAAQVLAQVSANCAALGGEVALEPGFRREQDLDGDGRLDLVIDHAAAFCSKRASLSCTMAGCAVSFWLARDEGYLGIFSDPIRGYEVEPGAVLALDLQGSACGSYGFDACRKRFDISGDEAVLIEALTGDAAIAAMEGRVLVPAGQIADQPPAPAGPEGLTAAASPEIAALLRQAPALPPLPFATTGPVPPGVRQPTTIGLPVALPRVRRAGVLSTEEPPGRREWTGAGAD